MTDKPQRAPNENNDIHSRTVQFIPVAVSLTQPTNGKGRTICKVIGCPKVDYRGTNGYCKQHFGVFFPSPLSDHPLGANDGVDWTCVCGENVSATKKRCWNCSKWRKGAKRKNDTSKSLCASDEASIRIPKLPPITGISAHPEASDQTTNKRKRSPLPNLKAHITLHATPTIDADIAKSRTPKECGQRWNALFEISDQLRTQNSTQHNSNGEVDPFDCSDLIVPPTTEILEQEADKAIQRWEDLDSRIVFEEDVAGLCDEISTSADNYEIVDGTIVGDGRRQRLMPPNFDYKCASMPHDTLGIHLNDDDGHQQQYYRPRVVSLLDPIQTLDHETELWHIFKSMPTTSDIERKYGILQDGQSDESSHALQHTLQVKHEVKTLVRKHTRMDAHSLGRLRLKDNHSLPPSLALQSSGKDGVRSHINTTIRFEVLRYSENMKRGAGRDCNRLDVELSGSQHKLLDLHRVLVESAYTAEGQSHTLGNSSLVAGVFFIENNFYTHGDNGEHVWRDILQWLDNSHLDESEAEFSNSGDRSDRRKHLCISSNNSSTPMSDVHLENLPLRLGIRYVHIITDQSSLRPNKISLRNESALFVTSIQTHKSNRTLTHPILHDKWTPLKPPGSCSACNSATATVVTMNDELASTESQGAQLCGACFRDLHYKVVSTEMCELRTGSVHQSFKVLPIDTFNETVLKSEVDSISDGAIF
ncbi:hypothetical protein ACHAWO_004530 [Cyclotella atomus]|uniref:GATA-type domain-containing protein n=1 Tax=Cyclotella atomus TaxID=382360 RepID=A0ABD3NDC2_9STRA